MKKLIIIALGVTLLSMASCSVPLQTTQRIEVVDFLDFRSYSESGFLLTPDPYTGEYHSLGQLELTVFPSTSYKKEKVGRYLVPMPSYKQEYISRSELTGMAVEKAKELGADGLVDFKISEIHGLGTTDKDGRAKADMAYKVTGLCIKRIF